MASCQGQRALMGNQSPLLEAADWSLLGKSHVGRSKNGYWKQLIGRCLAKVTWVVRRTDTGQITTRLVHHCTGCVEVSPRPQAGPSTTLT